VFINNTNPYGSWAVVGKDLAFIFDFAGINTGFLSIPVGYFDEATNTGYGIRGNIGASGGSVTLSDGSELKEGKYGSFYIQGGNNFFSYTPNSQKLAAVNSGVLVTDTFELLLTAPDGTSAEATYTVTIAGDGANILPAQSSTTSAIVTAPAVYQREFIDPITNFNPGTDRPIQIDLSSFDGALAKLRIFNNVKNLSRIAKTHADFVYDRQAGYLYYNENGNRAGFGEGGIIAILEGSPRVGMSNFEFV
jgi:VCBS repeat-containing protein